MDYDETNSDSDSDIDDYNYNNNTNNWSILTRDKINRQTDRHNNSLLDMINKKLESLEIVERSITYTRTKRKNDSFLDLYEKMKAVNFEPHHRTPSEKTMIEIESGSIIKTVDKRLKSTNRKAKEKDDIERQKSNNKKDDLIMERTTCIEDKEKGNSAIEIIQEKNDIERQKTIIRRGTVKEIIEKMERQNNSILKIANKEISSNNMGKRLYDR